MPSPHAHIRCLPSSPLLAAAFLILASVAGIRDARAIDPLGLYIGAAYGQAHIRADMSALSPSGAYPLAEFDATHSAYQAMLGIRPLSFLGAEIDYVDFGQRSLRPPAFAQPTGQVAVAGQAYPTSEQVSQKGEAAFALLYLPVPVIDVYVKAGISRMTTDAAVTDTMVGVLCQIGNPNCNTDTVGHSSTDTAFAYGAGVQWKLGHWAVRGEYERFDAAGANPTLLSIGMTYSIL